MNLPVEGKWKEVTADEWAAHCATFVHTFHTEIGGYLVTKIYNGMSADGNTHLGTKAIGIVNYAPTKTYWIGEETK